MCVHSVCGIVHLQETSHDVLRLTTGMLTQPFLRKTFTYTLSYDAASTGNHALATAFAIQNVPGGMDTVAEVFLPSNVSDAKLQLLK